MFNIFVRENSGANFTEITSNISRDSIRITDEIQEKANTAIFSLESLGTIQKAQELKIFDTTYLTIVSTKRLLTVNDLSNDVKKFRVGNDIWLNAGETDEEKVTIESVDTVSKQIGITSASTTFNTDALIGVKKFAGHIIKVSDRNLHQLKNVVYDVNCIDYTKEFNRKLINDSFTDKTAAQIIDEFVREVVNPGLSSVFTTTSVEAGITFTTFRAAFKSPVEVMQQLADESGEFSWFIDYNKDINFKSFSADASPFNLTTVSNNFIDLEVNADLTRVKNRQIVLGGFENSATKTTEFHNGDGAKREWLMRAKFSDMTIAVGTNSTSMTTVSVLPDFINTEVSADYFSNFQMQSVRAALTTSTLTTNDLIRFRYNEKIPINVLDEDLVSIAAIKALGFGDGIIEGRAIVDKSIETRLQVQNLARAELLKYSNTIINAKFVTEEQGLKSCQLIRINDSNRNLNQEFLIQRVREEVYAGEESRYRVVCASTLLGITELIQKLLKFQGKAEIDKNVGIDLIKLIREEISFTSSFSREEENDIRETISFTSSLTSVKIIPPFQYGAGGSPQGRWNLSEWS